MPQNVVQTQPFGLYSQKWGNTRTHPHLFNTRWERIRAIAREMGLSRSARARLEWMIWYETKGRRNASLTCRHFGISRKTFYHWRARYSETNLAGLEDLSRRPHRVRRSILTGLQQQRIIELRTKYIHYSKIKLAILYKERYGEKISSWQIQKVIQKHKLYPNPAKAKRTAAKRKKALQKRRITEFQQKEPLGFMFGIDTVQLSFSGNKRYLLTAVDRYSRLAFARIYQSHSSLAASDFLRRLHDLVGDDLVHIQTDNGSEFHKYFIRAAQELGLQHWWSRVRKPTDNAICERFNRTVQEEFIRNGNAHIDVRTFNRHLLEWLVEYNCVRPHAALNYKRPIEVACPSPKLLRIYSSRTQACLAGSTVASSLPPVHCWGISESRSLHQRRCAVGNLCLKPQEIALDDPHSDYMFQPRPTKPFVATPAAIETFGVECIVACLRQLQERAQSHDGLDYLQVFENDASERRLWFIEDGDGGAITALLPSDY